MTWEGSIEKEFWDTHMEYWQMQLDYVGEKAKRLGIDFNPDLNAKEDLGKALDNLVDIVDWAVEEYVVDEEEEERKLEERRQDLREKIENAENEEMREFLIRKLGYFAYGGNYNE